MGDRMARPARRRAAAVSACLLAAACAPASPWGASPGLPTWTLTPTQLDDLARNRTWEGRRRDGTPFVLYTDREGARRLREADRGDGAAAGAVTDTGVWSVEGNASCSRWTRTGNGGKRCVVIAPEGDGYVAYDLDGSPYATFQVREGNPHGL